MKKISILASSLLFAMASTASPSECPQGQIWNSCEGPQFGPGGCVPGCVVDPDSPISDKTNVTIPYFNTRSNWSTRFSVVNPTDKKVAVTVQIHDVDGVVRAWNHFVLTPYDMFASGLSPSSIPGNTWWFVPVGETTCKFYENSNVPIDEGYLTVSSEEFTTFGPAGFCGNDYELIDVNKLNYEYSIWNNDGLLRNNYQELPSVNSKIASTWTQNGDRSTDVVINLSNYQLGQCQEAEYLIANRQGQFFKTFDTTEPGPAGWANFQFCHKVNVVHFGKPIFDTQVGINANDQMFMLNNPDYFNNEINAGWAQWVIEGQSFSIRSEF